MRKVSFGESYEAFNLQVWPFCDKSCHWFTIEMVVSDKKTTTIRKSKDNIGTTRV